MVKKIITSYINDTTVSVNSFTSLDSQQKRLLAKNVSPTCAKNTVGKSNNLTMSINLLFGDPLSFPGVSLTSLRLHISQGPAAVAVMETSFLVRDHPS